MSANPGHHHDQIDRIIKHLRAGDGLDVIVDHTGIGGVNAKGRRAFRRWLGRHGRIDLWEWIRENTTPWSNTWTT